MKRNLVRLVGLTILLAALLGLFLPVQIMAVTDIQPQAFYGNLKLSSGGDAPAGSVVTAKINGVVCSNSLVTTIAGKYGGSYHGDACLIVQSNQPDGTPIEFFVNGQPATPSDPVKAVFSRLNSKVELGLTYTPVSGGGGGGGLPGGGTTTPTPTPTGTPVPVTVNGKTVDIEVSNQGEVLKSLEVKSPDDQVTVSVSGGTKMALSDGSAPTSISVTPDPTLPPPPADATIIGVPYKCEPSGLTFSPPIQMVFKYNPKDFPAGINEAELKVAFYNEATGQWETVPCLVNTETNEIIAIVSHFTDYAVIAPQAPATTTPPATQTTTPAVTTTPAATPPASTTSAAATTSTAPSVTTITTTTSETVSSPVNWGMIGGIIGALVVVIVFLMILLLRRRTH